MKKLFRLISMGLILLSLVLLSAGATVWASPSQQQGTIPLPIATEATPDPEGEESVDLNTGTGAAELPPGSIPEGGQATAEEVPVDPTGLGLGLDDLSDDTGDMTDATQSNSPPPADQEFLSNGFALEVTDEEGDEVVFLGGSTQICFPALPGSTALVHKWYTVAELNAVLRELGFRPTATEGRWVPFPTFTRFEQGVRLRCTQTRIPGTYALIGTID